METVAGPQRRISIFLNVFNVHVNRAPIAGNVQLIDYQKGKYLNAMNPDSAIENERNYVEVAGELCTVAFTQIAGLLARRIVFQKKVGDWVHRGERVGLIKFGSRVDVVFPLSCEVQVSVGQIVHGGASILAIMPSSDMEDELLAAVSVRCRSLWVDDGAGAMREVDGRKRRPARRGMYILPSLFTAGSIAAGFYAIVQSLQGSSDRTAPLRSRCSRDWAGDSFRWAGWPHRPHDEYRVRLWQGTRLPCRRDYVSALRPAFWRTAGVSACCRPRWTRCCATS